MQVVAKRGKPTAVVYFWGFIGLITETGQRLRLLLDRANMNRAMGTHKSYACPPPRPNHVLLISSPVRGV